MIEQGNNLNLFELNSKDNIKKPNNRLEFETNVLSSPTSDKSQKKSFLMLHTMPSLN